VRRLQAAEGRRIAAGFTIVEVLVALVIVSLALVAASDTITTMTRNSDTLRDRTYANWIAQNRITEIRLSGELPEVDITNGEVEYGIAIWEWESEVTETGIENLRRIDVSVTRQGYDGWIWTVTGLVGEPSPPGVAASAWTIRTDPEGVTR